MTRQAFDADTAAARVVEAMRPLASATRAVQEKRYLKSDLDFLGVGVPGIRKVVTEAARSYDGLDRESALAWARALWREPVHERRMAAIEVLRRYVRILQPADLPLVELGARGARLGLRRLAGRGRRGHDRPHSGGRLAADRRLGLDEDFWFRRSALLTLLPGIRQGLPDHARFSDTPPRCWPRRSSS